MNNKNYTISDLKKAVADALKLNALCVGHFDDNPDLPRNEDGSLREDISNARWKVHDIINILESSD